MRAITSGNLDLSAAVSDLHFSPDRQKSADLPAQNATQGARTCAATWPPGSHVPVAHHQRRGSFGVLCRWNRTIPHQCRHHVRAPEKCAGNLRRIVHEDCGAETLGETARLWLDFGLDSDEKGGKFCIKGATGPDEYNAVVNNNAYTNLMARENLRYAAETVESLRATQADAYEMLVHKTALEPSEAQTWLRAAESMYVPYDEKRQIIPQDDSFLDREAWDFQNTPPNAIRCCCFTTH